MINRFTAWLLLGSVLAIVAAYNAGLWIGHGRGAADTKAKVEEARQAVQSELYKLGDELARRSAALEQARAERDRNAEDLENAARKDPGASGRVPSADSLHRLQRRWSAP